MPPELGRARVIAHCLETIGNIGNQSIWCQGAIGDVIPAFNASRGNSCGARILIPRNPRFVPHGRGKRIRHNSLYLMDEMPLFVLSEPRGLF